MIGDAGWVWGRYYDHEWVNITLKEVYDECWGPLGAYPIYEKGKRKEGEDGRGLV